MDDATYVIGLVRRALDDADDPSVLTSTLTNRAIRVARLRGDSANLWWLLREMQSVEKEMTPEHNAWEGELRPAYDTAEWDAMRRRVGERWMYHRTGERGVQAMALPELEACLAAVNRHASELTVPAGLSPYQTQQWAEANDSLRAEWLTNSMDTGRIVARVRQAVVSYLGRVEQQIMFGHVSSNVFERNRRWVDDQLSRVDPDALDKFATAYRRAGDGTAESRAHALTSCRRVLKSLADTLQPATGESVVGLDGVERDLTDDRYLNGLTEYVRQAASRSTARDLLLTQLTDLGRRLSALNDLSSKGVHDEPTVAEVDQCLIQTYLTVGDLMRIEADLPARTGEA